MTDSGITRRPIAARQTKWAAAVAAFLARSGARPNLISLCSILFAACAAACLFAIPLTGSAFSKVALYAGVVIFVPLRLLCNLFDGMVAVEGGFRTPLGELYNEMPDRISDVLILAGAGFSTGCQTGINLGWLCSVLAVLTAYVRAMGGATGVPQPFCGPMAKQQRMAAVIIASTLSAAELIAERPPVIMSVALAVIAAGSAVTCVRRTIIIAGNLNSKK